MAVDDIKAAFEICRENKPCAQFNGLFDRTLDKYQRIIDDCKRAWNAFEGADEDDDGTSAWPDDPLDSTDDDGDGDKGASFKPLTGQRTGS